MLQMKSHNAKNTASEYLDAFYKTFDDVKDQKFDGLIITGAPIENYDFRMWISGRNCAKYWNGKKPCV